MESSDLIELLQKGEGKTLEYKQELSSKSHESLAKTVCAFANTAGGHILFGIEDKTKYVVGVLNIQALEADLVNIIDTHITPKIIPDIEILPYQDKTILCVRIHPNSPLRPYYLSKKGGKKGTFIRIGSSNREADLQNIEELERISRNVSFEEQLCVGLDESAIDLNAVVESFASIRQIEFKDLLTLKLTTVGSHGKPVPTNAGMILFGKERIRYFPNAKIKAVRFSGITRDPNYKIIDQKEIDSYLVIAVQEAVNFIKKHANYESMVDTSQHAEQWNIQRTERWNIPMAAIREAITNAIVHTDYSHKGSDIHIFMYQDRIEIQNPGLLVTGLTLDDLVKGISKLRNPVIGNIFNKLGFIEQYGSGINEIIEECQKYGLEAPKFEELATHFRVTIYTVPKKTPSFDEQDNIILDILRYQYFSNRKEKGLSTKEITERTHLTQRATRVRLASLVQKGLISEIGKSATDPKKKYYLREEYAKISVFIGFDKLRQDLEDILNSGLLRDEQEKIQKVEEILKFKATPIPPEWHWQQGFFKKGNVNCFAFALGLADFESYRAKIKQGSNDPHDFASSLFVKYFLEHKGLTPVDYPEKNSLVVYYDQNESIRHVGIVEDTLSITIRSKWGTFPVIFKHRLRDIPSSYGSIVRFYPPIDAEEALRLFKAWTSQGRSMNI